MARKFSGWILASLGLFIAISNAIAIHYHLYYHLWWLDIPMHVVGGLWVALLALTGYYSPRVREPKRHGDPAALRIAVLSALVIGLAWELFEFSLDAMIVFGPYDMSDTLNDLLNDVTGAAFAALIFVTEKCNRTVAPAPHYD